jgi:hypothetical protein
MLCAETRLVVNTSTITRPKVDNLCLFPNQLFADRSALATAIIHRLKSARSGRSIQGYLLLKW